MPSVSRGLVSLRCRVRAPPATPVGSSGSWPTRTPQGLYDELKDVHRSSAKLAVEGIAWYLKNIEGLPAPKGDDVYTIFGDANLYPFIKWIDDIFSAKTPELRRQTIVAAMHATFEKNEEEARKFWKAVARGGV